jgi:hypothetical protein
MTHITKYEARSITVCACFQQVEALEKLSAAMEALRDAERRYRLPMVRNAAVEVSTDRLAMVRIAAVEVSADRLVLSPHYFRQDCMHAPHLYCKYCDLQCEKCHLKIFLQSKRPGCRADGLFHCCASGLLKVDEVDPGAIRGIAMLSDRMCTYAG